MALLLLIGFVAGVITAVSPCVLPVLPIVLAGGAAGSRRRPYAIIAGLVVSFTVFTLAATALLSALGLPQDLLHNLAIALLFVVAISLMVPRIGMLIELPLSRLSRRRRGDLGGGFLLGASLGLVFVPCAGPVLATVSVLAAQHRIGVGTVFLTLFYALGAGLVLLLVAIGGQRLSKRLRVSAHWLRPALGVVIALAATAIVFNLDQSLQTRLGSYTNALQRHTEQSASASRQLAKLRGGGGGLPKAGPSKQAGVGLPDYGTAPDFRGIVDWLNTPQNRPISIAHLRGQVVLVDFWTYSCINCLRTLSHLRAWYAAYHRDGFTIVGVHSPEFAFEHVPSNVRAAVQRLSVDWPVALDNNFSTWNAYSNQYWPADYLVDRTGQIRDVSFGEGGYSKTEADMRLLLGLKAFSKPNTSVPDKTPTGATTPETYLGTDRLDHSLYAGSAIVKGKQAAYKLAATVPVDSISYGGLWKLSGQTALAGASARLELHFRASDVYVVLGGRGRVTTLLNGKPLGVIDVKSDRLYTAFQASAPRDALLELRFSPGVEAFSFTFG